MFWQSIPLTDIFYYLHYAFLLNSMLFYFHSTQTMLKNKHIRLSFCKSLADRNYSICFPSEYPWHNVSWRTYSVLKGEANNGSHNATIFAYRTPKECFQVLWHKVCVLLTRKNKCLQALMSSHVHEQVTLTCVLVKNRKLLFPFLLQNRSLMTQKGPYLTPSTLIKTDCPLCSLVFCNLVVSKNAIVEAEHYFSPFLRVTTIPVEVV